MEVPAIPATPSPEDKARYEAARKELEAALKKKRAVDRQLAQLEVQIYNFEGSYLAETAQHSGGNIIQGFDGYLKTQSVGRRRHEPTDADRVFSNSSLTYQKSLELMGEVDSDTAPNSQQQNPNTSLPLQLSSIPNTPLPTSLALQNSLSLSNRSTPGLGNGPGGMGGGLTSIVLPPPTSHPSSTNNREGGGTGTGTGTGGGGRTQTDKETQQLSAAAQKKARDKEYQRRKRDAARQRSAALAAQAAAQAQAQAAAAQAQANGQAGGVAGSGVAGTGGSGDAGSTGGETGGGDGSSVRARPSKKPRQADDD